MSFITIQSFSNYIDAHIVLGRLKDAGIDCWLKNEATATIIPVWTTAIGGIQLMVAKDQLQKAGFLLQKIAEEKMVNRLCPYCFSHNVEYINTMRKPVNWLSALVTFFLGDLALMPEQRYHCFHCSKEFERPLEAGNN
jgi:DNA-directed RNA polymerase subunit RPC12/RpoP